jgi:hypothetical protein
MAISVRHVILAVTFAASSAGLLAQGGPPMLTDDTGTPGPGHWELNFSTIVQHAAGTTEWDLPYLDLNYGVGERGQITCQVFWETERPAGGSDESGLGASVLGYKWRFFDQGDKGWQVSTFPQFTFSTPGSDSDRRGLASADPGLLLPIEVERDVGPVSANLEVGRMLGPQGRADQLGVGGGWLAGLALGKTVAPGVELDAELHTQTSSSPSQVEWTLNAGTRIDTSRNTTILFSIGRDVRNTLSPRVSVLSYLGLQVRI